MTLTELKYIVAVAREKHFGRAADACFVSQPTLSVAIKKLEEELQLKLFERSANEVNVTPLGEEIVRQAQSVLEQAANIKEIAKRGKDPLAGPLTLGLITTNTFGDGGDDLITTGVGRDIVLGGHQGDTITVSDLLVAGADDNNIVVVVLNWIDAAVN